MNRYLSETARVFYTLAVLSIQGKNSGNLNGKEKLLRCVIERRGEMYE